MRVCWVKHQSGVSRTPAKRSCFKIKFEQSTYFRKEVQFCNGQLHISCSSFVVLNNKSVFQTELVVSEKDGLTRERENKPLKDSIVGMGKGKDVCPLLKN